MTQKEQVIEALAANGGYATFSELNLLVDTSNWRSKTPGASIRRIVQQDAKMFYRIMPGQWGLVSMKRGIEANGATARSTEYTHSYYQGQLVEIGNIDQFETYVPPQDKNRMFSHRKLGEVASLQTIYEFASEQLLRRARTVDAIWFNCRHMPHSFFEVEHTTSIQNSLDKFFELQDFAARFVIVSQNSNKARFDDLMSWSRYREINGRVQFYSYERLEQLYSAKLISAANAI